MQLLDMSDVVYDTKCPYWDQVSLNSPQLNSHTFLSLLLLSPLGCLACKGKDKDICFGVQTFMTTRSSDFFPLTACKYWSNLVSMHQESITTGWILWNTKFAWHFYTWSVLGIKPQTFWSSDPRPSDLNIGHVLQQGWTSGFEVCVDWQHLVSLKAFGVTRDDIFLHLHTTKEKFSVYVTS